MSYQLLPKELIQEISKRLNVEEILSECQVDKRLSKFCKDDRFWEYYVKQRYEIKYRPDNLAWKNFAILLDKILLVFSQTYKAIRTDLFSFLIEKLIESNKISIFDNLDDFDYFAEDAYGFYGYKDLPYYINFKVTGLDKIVDQFIDEKYALDFSQYPKFEYRKGGGLQYFNSKQIDIKNELLNYIRAPTIYWFGTNKYVVNFDSMFPYYEIEDYRVVEYLTEYTNSLNITLFDEIYQDMLNDLE